MTDGIIQEVFKKYHIRHSSTITRVEHNELIIELEEDLIEKIKQTSFSNQWLFDNETKKKLIGDNQE